MKPLTKDEARLALCKGQGRIVLHLQEHGVAGLEDELLEACQRSLVYDTQSEGTREEWLLSLMELTGQPDFYRDRVLEALPIATEIWDVAQLQGLAKEFAQRGCSQARAALYASFDKQEFPEDWQGGWQIVELDGIVGMLHVAEVCGSRLKPDSRYWVDDSLLSQTCKQYGEEMVMTALKQSASHCPAVQAYLDGIHATRTRRQKLASVPSAKPTVDEVLAAIETGQNRGLFIGFGRTATEHELDQIFQRLLTESRPEQLARYLRVFWRRALPRLEQRVLELAESPDEEVQVAALTALSNSQDPSIRDLGLRLLRVDPSTAARRAFLLFQRNYAPGDHAILEAALPTTGDPCAIHGIGFDLLDVAKSQPDPELAACLEWLYESTPCSNCRGEALEKLLKRDRAPARFLEEAAWDCAEETRTLAREALQRIR